ncbi:MAG: cytochrome C oxidase subunit IV family protein [Candidatus Pacebacteria bacterium]|nr:cytochrome C oxidase subunit IV family protein [Candidatus Paceibacterota bacterium]
MSANDYFGDVGMWHKGARHVGATYLLGFILSLLLTLGAYAAAVYDLVSANILVPLVLVLACLQFMVQVLGFLHVSGARSSRDRLIALGATTIIILILVIGSMWIMNTLDERMMPDEAQMERYMQRQQGI